jgi:glycerol-3-phosphate acyltransferase PlsX
MRYLTISLDAMGGDNAPDVVMEGASLARERYPDIRFLIFGDEARLRALAGHYPRLKDCCEIRHTTDVVGADDKPGQALRRSRSSSMGLAIEAVNSGEAMAAVSAGNTGALMALAKFTLKMLPGIDRPALATLIPTIRGESVMLDLGANVECDEGNLVQFAIMGSAFARTILGLKRPTVALLNVGVEEAKGNDAVKGAGQKLKDMPVHMEFAGFIEGDGIGAGKVDVIVTDGFTGNVALKTAEGTARMIAKLLGKAFRHSLLSKIGYILARGGIKALQSHLDPNNHNGAVFLGLKGLVVKSHGSANGAGFASAIGVAYDMAADDLCGKISSDLEESAAYISRSSEVAAS